MAEKIGFDLTKLIIRVTLVQWSSSCFHVKPGSTPGKAVFCFVVPFFSSFFFFLFFSPFWRLFLKPFGLFSFIHSADPALGSIDILNLSSEFYFGRGLSRALDLHTGQAYGQKKSHKLSRRVLPLKKLIFFFNVS